MTVFCYPMRIVILGLTLALCSIAQQALADTIVWIYGPGDRHQTVIIRDIRLAIGPGGATRYEFLDADGYVLGFMQTDGTDPFDHTNVVEMAFTPAFNDQLIDRISLGTVQLEASDAPVTDDGTGRLYAAAGVPGATFDFSIPDAAAGEPAAGSIMFGALPGDNLIAYSVRAGRCDCFRPGPEATNPRPSFASFASSIYAGPGPASFDDPDINEWLGHSFTNLPKGCIREAVLTIKAKPNEFARNDALWIGQEIGTATTLTNHFTGWSYGQTSGTKPVLFPGYLWDSVLMPATCGYTIRIDLNIQAGTTGQTLIDRMNQLGYLDVYSQDDTGIDCMTLTVKVDPDCNPCDDPCPADFDGDGQLTIFDFLAFQSAFDAGCP